MTSYAEMSAKVSRALQDPGNDTFTSQQIDDMIASAYSEVSLVAPWQFIEDITPVADTLEYMLLQDHFDHPVNEVEVMSVELWDGTTTPPTPLRWVVPQSQHPSGLAYNEVGWRVWAGTLMLPRKFAMMIDPDRHFLRVMGYSPWPLPVYDIEMGWENVSIPFTPLLQEAVVTLCRIDGLRLLTQDRALFKQWQTGSNNTDVSVPMLMNDLNMAQQQWQRTERRIHILREAP